ncbi:hypothetical protein KQX54_013128 [Cotesia glomerata]|uniref:Uncharacterized protein n=1 Tax=Cotesia glomerata TaxID=32391 RepID=A0AAV7HYG7_COTGL|nr:hypothetical protein KQX54_013128 [Cotesia glomerata]
MNPCDKEKGQGKILIRSVTTRQQPNRIKRSALGNQPLPLERPPENPAVPAGQQLVPPRDQDNHPVLAEVQDNSPVPTEVQDNSSVPPGVQDDASVLPEQIHLSYRSIKALRKFNQKLFESFKTETVKKLQEEAEQRYKKIKTEKHEHQDILQSVASSNSSSDSGRRNQCTFVPAPYLSQHPPQYIPYPRYTEIPQYPMPPAPQYFMPPASQHPMPPAPQYLVPPVHQYLMPPAPQYLVPPVSQYPTPQVPSFSYQPPRYF